MTTSRGAAAHLNDEVLIRLLSDELSTAEAQEPKEHLATCWKCRARYEELEEVALGVATLSKEKAGPDGEPPTEDDPFFKRLRVAVRESLDGSWWTRLLPKLQVRAIQFMNPVAATVLVVACTVAVLLYVWQRNPATVTASDFMNRAVTADARVSSVAESGVVYQKIGIRTGNGTFERAVYRDVTGQRRPSKTNPDKVLALYEAKLAVAGIVWEEPLSAASFKTWHDGQRDAKDEVKKSGDGLLTLTTTVSNGIVSKESVTVRESTFHTVERTVEFVDIGSVDFLELNYDILAWNAVSSDLFEPVPEMAAIHPSAHPAPALASLIPLTSAQLDEAELQARLVLNELNADSSERHQVARNATEVEVSGIVATKELEFELQAGLQGLAHVSASIATFDEVKSLPTGSNEISSVQSASIVAQPSPLVNYLIAHGHVPMESAALSQQLFSSALAAQQETKAIADLTGHFASGETLTENGAAAFRELLVRHRASLLAALNDEEKVLAETGIYAPAPQPLSNAPGSETDTPNAAEKNLHLCKELNSTNEETGRPVEQVVPEILDSAARLRAFAQEPPAELPKGTKQNEKP
jgi:anti-sigma factor RsiW